MALTELIEHEGTVEGGGCVECYPSFPRGCLNCSGDVHAEALHLGGQPGQEEGVFTLECEGCDQPAPEGIALCIHKKDPRVCEPCLAQVTREGGGG